MKMSMKLFALCALLCGAAGAAANAADVTIKADGNARQIQAGTYQAVVAADGCLTNLRVNGQEFLRPGVQISRGSYFHQNGVIPMPQIAQPAENVITAEGEKAAVRYEFGADTMTWTVSNKTTAAMSFFLVFDPAVNAVKGEDGQFVKPSVNETWTNSTWFRDKARLEISGSNRQWGPWSDCQVWEASLAANETRKISFKLGAASDAEAAQAAAAGAPKPLVEADLTIHSPLNYQVFQRQTRLQGAVLVSGRVRPACDKVEVRITGNSLKGALSGKWQSLPLIAQTRSFSKLVPTPAGGWYLVEVHALQGKKVVAEAKIENVGVGEVFVGAGQSNSTNCGQERTSETSGMVSAFSGSNWQLANDPQPGPHDRTGGGSFWPSFGDAMYAKYKVPIGVAVTGHGGTSINQWQPDGELFAWMVNRMNQLGRNGFRAVLWHQGESDVYMPVEDYVRKLTTVIWASKDAAGWEFPWFVAKVSYHNPQNTSFPTTRAAHQKLWDTGVALEGPDTDTLGSEYRDHEGKGIHFSPKGLAAHGKLWCEKVGAYLDKVLAE